MALYTMNIASVRSYIVRIYRASRNRPDRLLGVIEEVGKGEERLFRNVEDLWRVLNAPGRSAKNPTGKEELRNEPSERMTKKDETTKENL